MIGASSAQASAAKTLPRSSSERPPNPPKIAPHWIMWPSDAMSPATEAAMVAMSMSRFRTCESSWARTPSSWRRSRMRRMPSVTATAACAGFRPVANAFGVADGMT